MALNCDKAGAPMALWAASRIAQAALGRSISTFVLIGGNGRQDQGHNRNSQDGDVLVIRLRARGGGKSKGYQQQPQNVLEYSKTPYEPVPC